MEKVKIFSSSKTKWLATEVAQELGLELGKCKISTFSDGEISPQFEETIRGCQVFLFGSTCNDIMELLLMIDAAKRASAEEIVAVVPYYGYARQDRKEGARGAIGAKLVADLLTTAGANRVMTVDLHAAQIQGFFNIPVDHIGGHSVFVPYLTKMISELDELENSWVVCTPDAGGFQRASKIANKLNLSIVAINKRRDKPNSIGSMELVGDVVGKNVIIVDDMVDTAGTLCKAAEYLIECGAKSVRAVCTHALLSGEATTRLNASKLKELIVSNSVPYNPGIHLIKFTTVSASPILAKIIQRVVEKESINEVNN